MRFALLDLENIFQKDIKVKVKVNGIVKMLNVSVFSILESKKTLKIVITFKSSLNDHDLDLNDKIRSIIRT